MEVDFFLFFIGVFAGIVTGFVPGIHSNTAVAIIASLGFRSDRFASIAIGLFPAHIIASFVPSIFFGIPEQGVVLSVLPGQRLVLEGRGLLALKTILVACALSILLCAAVFLPSLSAYSFIYGLIKDNVKIIVPLVCIFLFMRSKNPILSLLFFLLAGGIGAYTLNSDMEDPFLPVFSGMFAVAAIMNYSPHKIPAQHDEGIDRSALKWVPLGVLLGMFADLLPGIGSPSQVAAFATIMMPSESLSFLVLISSIAVSGGIFTLSTAASIGKARMGATAAIADSIDIGQSLPGLLSLALLSSAICVCVLFLLRTKISRIAGVDFTKANTILLLYLVAINLLINGIAGVFVLLIASLLGWLTIKLDVERTNLMGAVIVPTILLLYGIFS